MNIVLVHGAWADGSSWSAVIERLQAGGHNVTAPRFKARSLVPQLWFAILLEGAQSGTQKLAIFVQ
jgi:hypothetical protein